MNNISIISKICLALSIVIMITFFSIQSLIVFGVWENSIELSYFGYGCFLAFTPFFGYVIYEFLTKKEIIKNELIQKNTYLEHAAKILRHDMHSGINTYMPRGLSSLERRLTPQQIKELKIESPLKMIKEGLRHTQKVYRGVFEFTNLVKKDSVLEKEECNIKDILEDYLSATSYKSQVLLNPNLPTIEVNSALFCTAIDNLIRNGLKYNDSSSKEVRIYSELDYICIEDNGRGMSQEDFEKLSNPYTRKDGQKESGSGLGLNICKSIIEEHGFGMYCRKLRRGESDFFNDLNSIEERIGENTNNNILNKEVLIEKAKEDNFQGKLITKRGKRNSDKVYVIYKEGNNLPQDSINNGTKIKIKIK
jgi:signal transduction histidine kinase